MTKPMSKKEKVMIFENELKWIKNKDIRKFAIEMISALPDYFFEVPASSTGKYHPSYSLGQQGLVRHTKGAILIAKTLLDLEQYKNQFTEEQRDVMLTALILHDGMKHGIEGGKYTVATHPTDMVDFINNNKKTYQLLNANIVGQILSCIATHMGEFNQDYRTKKEILPKPQTDMQKFVHECDFLASRRFFEINFDKVEY